MENSELTITADTGGHNWSVPVLHFKGRDKTAAKVYMQAALHASELPGTAVLHFLCQMLRYAEAQGQIAGDITIIPQANPIGTAQNIYMQSQGRFDNASGINFNRDFPLVALKDRETLLDTGKLQTATQNLKNNLIYMALDADIVIDLHCDYEALLYAYVCEEFWPDCKDFAAAMNVDCVFLADGQSTAFEEAVAYAFRSDSGENKPRRFVTTLELRGLSDVDETVAKHDAEGLFKFLTGRGVITGSDQQKSQQPQPDWNGSVTPLDNIEVIRAEHSGTVLFNRNIGDTVKTGDLLATIITAPGEENGTYQVKAPQDGIFVTRANYRYAARGDQLCKIACNAPSTKERTPGTLES